MGEHPVKILQVQIGGKTFSGVSSYLYQYYKHMDHNKIHYDFLFCRENSMELVKDDPEVKDSEFYVLNAVKGKSNDYVAIKRGVHKVLKEKRYDAIVVNTSIVAVIYACMLGVKGIKNTKFIAHAHNTDLVLRKNSLRARFLLLSKLLDEIMRIRVRKKSDYLFACSEAAAEMTFGKGSSRLEKCKLIKNAIDIEAYEYNPVIRNTIRKEFNTADTTFVYGNVGSFCKRKNQAFLIQIFQLLHAQCPDIELWLIGDGNDRKMIEDLINQLKLQDAVKLLGQRNNVNEIMQGMDCFVFPTLSEGLGIVAIEAQAAGLPTVVSDGVPKDVMITDLAIMIKLDKGEVFWANEIENIRELIKRKDERDKIINSGYDIRKESMNLTRLLESID